MVTSTLDNDLALAVQTVHVSKHLGRNLNVTASFADRATKRRRKKEKQERESQKRGIRRKVLKYLQVFISTSLSISPSLFISFSILFFRYLSFFTSFPHYLSLSLSTPSFSIWIAPSFSLTALFYPAAPSYSEIVLDGNWIRRLVTSCKRKEKKSHTGKNFEEKRSAKLQIGDEVLHRSFSLRKALDLSDPIFEARHANLSRHMTGKGRRRRRKKKWKGNRRKRDWRLEQRSSNKRCGRSNNSFVLTAP